MKKVIFLDWNGTLSNSFFWEHMRVSNEEKTKSLYGKWDKALFSKPKEYIRDWMRGKNTTEAILKGISEETETSYKDVFDEFVKGCKSMKFVSDELPKTISELQEKGFYVVIATNNMDCFTRWTVPSMRLDEIFDEILNSFCLKGLKHDVDENGKSIFFHDFFSRKKVSKSNCFFIDDSIDKDNYISDLGIHYIQLKKNDELVKVLKFL